MLAMIPEPDPWAKFRLLGSMDERILWATLAAALLLGLWGAFVGWRTRDETSDRDRT